MDDILLRVIGPDTLRTLLLSSVTAVVLLVIVVAVGIQSFSKLVKDNNDDKNRRDDIDDMAKHIDAELTSIKELVTNELSNISSKVTERIETDRVDMIASIKDITEYITELDARLLSNIDNRLNIFSDELRMYNIYNSHMNTNNTSSTKDTFDMISHLINKDKNKNESIFSGLHKIHDNEDLIKFMKKIDR